MRRFNMNPESMFSVKLRIISRFSKLKYYCHFAPEKIVICCIGVFTY